MRIDVVLQQMIIIFILIGVGALLYRKSMLNELSSRQLSSIIVNLCNPALLICSAFDSAPKASAGELVTGAFIVALAYAVLLCFSYIMPYVLRVPQKERFAWRLITVYGNVGFIGIPLVGAVLGPGSLIYVSLNNLVYNVLIYTHGMSLIGKAAGGANKKAEESAPRSSVFVKSFINVGTLSAVITIVLYLCDFNVPVLVSDTLTYIGRSTTFLSMLVLGVSVAQMPLREIFYYGRPYLFTLIRMILLPVGCIFLFRLFTDNALMIYTTVLLLSVPAGNMPLILCRQYDVDSPVISRGIILTTLLSLITIPLVTLFL